MDAPKHVVEFFEEYKELCIKHSMYIGIEPSYEDLIIVHEILVDEQWDELGCHFEDLESSWDWHHNREN